MLTLLLFSFAVFVLLVVAVRKFLTAWMRVDDVVRKSAEQSKLMDASVLTNEEKLLLRNRTKEKLKSGMAE